MAINLTFMATEAPVVIYLPDGSSKQFPPQEEEHFQLPGGSFVTISSTAANEESGEHPPSGEQFVEAMIAFWQKLLDEVRESQPQANPL